MEKLLKQKAQMKKKKPVFVRQEAHVRKRLGMKWRRPRGIHSKMRERRAGKRVTVKAGYRLPCKTRGLHRTGMVIVKVSNLSQLDKINKETQITILSSTIGQKKKLQMLKRVVELGIKLVNIKNPKKALEKIETKIKKKKEAKQKKAEEKKKKKPILKKPEKKKEEPKKEVKPAEKKPAPKPTEIVPTAAELAKAKAQSESKDSAEPSSKGATEAKK